MSSGMGISVMPSSPQRNRNDRHDLISNAIEFGLAHPVRTIYSHMAMHYGLSLDLTFHALADGTRRSMIHALASGETHSAGELGRQFRSAQPTISKHLKVLEE